MTTPALSYIITTKNKLPYLKQSMARLLKERQEDEDILVADGASTDGTKGFLAELYQTGTIKYYSSEPDEGESHALNKLLFRAQGQLIKIITDDDVFFYPAIRACKAFLLAHPEIDMVGTEGGASHTQDPDNIAKKLMYEKDYRKWQAKRTPFCFCGLGIMLRRSSLPILGLWDPSFRRADAEFSYRVTAGKANIAWYTGYSFVNVSNPQSTSIVYMKKIKGETDRLEEFYRPEDPSLFSKLKRMKAVHDLVFKRDVIGNKLQMLYKKFIRWKRGIPDYEKTTPTQFLARSPELFAAAEKWLEEKNREKIPEFLVNR